MCVFSERGPYLTIGGVLWIVDMALGMNNGMYSISLMTCVVCGEGGCLFLCGL